MTGADFDTLTRFISREAQRCVQNGQDKSPAREHDPGGLSRICVFRPSTDPLNGNPAMSCIGPNFALDLPFDDSAPAGATVSALSIPPGYTAELIYDCEGRFTLASGALKTTALPLAPGLYRPYLRAKKNGTPDVTLRPRIRVAAAFSPAEIDGLAAAWVSDRGLTVDGSNRVTGWEGAFGTTIDLTGGAEGTRPVRDTIKGPRNKPVVIFSAGSARFLSMSAATPTLNACTIFAVTRKLDNGSTVRPLIGNTAGGRFIGTHSNVIDANFGSTANVAAPASASINRTDRYQSICVTHDAGGSAAGFVDGIAGGTANAGTSGGAFNCVGRHNTSYANDEITALLVYDRKLNAAEIVKIFAFLEPYRTTEWFFSATGDDANLGMNENTPRKSFATVMGSAGAGKWRQGDCIRVKGGDFFYDVVITNTNAFVPTQARPVTIDSYGTGRARLWGQAPSDLNWSSAGSDTWTAPLSRSNTPMVLWWYRDGIGADPVHIYRRALDEARSFDYAGGTISLRLEAGRNPNNETIVIPKDASGQTFWGGSKADVGFRDLEIRHYVGQVWAPQGQRNTVRECDVGFTRDDGSRRAARPMSPSSTASAIAARRARSPPAPATESPSMAARGISSSITTSLIAWSRASATRWARAR